MGHLQSELTCTTGREQGSGDSEGWGQGADSRSPKLWGKVRTTSSKDCWCYDLRMWGGQAGRRHREEMSQQHPAEIALLCTVIY